MIVDRDLDALYVTGPGHGGPGVVANAWLEGTYSELYPAVSEDAAGHARGCSGSSPSPAASPATSRRRRPGSIHEGGELGYSLAHAYGAAFDNPDLLVACVIGDGEAETGPLAASWHSNKFLDPVGDGAVLPILHLNGYKIANPTVLARIPHDELLDCMRGYGYQPYLVAGDDPAEVHQRAGRDAGRGARRDRRDPAPRPRRRRLTRPRWPMIVLRTPKGWTGPRRGRRPAGRGHLAGPPGAAGRGPATNPAHLAQLEEWMRCYRPEELFDADRRGRCRSCARSPRAATRRMSANPHANGGLLLRDLRLPDFRDYAVDGRARRARRQPSATRVLGALAARRDARQPATVPAVRARTRPRPTGSARSSRPPTGSGRPRSLPGDDHLAPTAG